MLERLFMHFKPTPYLMVGIAFIIILAAFTVWWNKNHGISGKPNWFNHDGYYKIVSTPFGFAVAGSNHRLLEMHGNYYYLKKDPFNIEAVLDEVTAANGRKYRAFAVSTVYIPEDKADFVAARYFAGTSEKYHCDGEMEIELISAFSLILNNIVSVYDGTADISELKKKYMGDIMVKAMEMGFLVSLVPTFNIVEIKE